MTAAAIEIAGALWGHYRICLYDYLSYLSIGIIATSSWTIVPNQRALRLKSIEGKWAGDWLFDRDGSLAKGGPICHRREDLAPWRGYAICRHCSSISCAISRTA
jgi:hypothetical protein